MEAIRNSICYKNKKFRTIIYIALHPLIITVVFLFIYHITAIIRVHYSDPPVITPSGEDLTVIPNANVNLTCTSNLPVYWRFFNDFDGEHKIHESYNETDDYPYKVVLEMKNVNYLYTGYYYCVQNVFENKAERVKYIAANGLASKIYLFVEDPSHPLVYVDDPGLEAAEHDDIVIPCKPTSKMWNITLVKEGKEEKLKSEFDPKIGFRISNIVDNGEYNMVYFRCTGVSGLAEEINHFDVDVTST